MCIEFGLSRLGTIDLIEIFCKKWVCPSSTLFSLTGFVQGQLLQLLGQSPSWQEENKASFEAARTTHDPTGSSESVDFLCSCPACSDQKISWPVSFNLISSSCFWSNLLVLHSSVFWSIYCFSSCLPLNSTFIRMINLLLSSNMTLISIFGSHLQTFLGFGSLICFYCL